MSEILIRAFQDNDYEKLAEFMSSFPGDNRTTDEWKQRLFYWWDNNPAYQIGHTRGVVLLYDNHIVGFTGNVPTKMLWNGKETIVINGTSWRVLPAYRKYSMDLWFTHRDLTKEMVYFNTTPTPEVRVLLLKMGYFAYSFKGEKIYHYLHIHKHKEINKLLVIPILIYMYFIRFYTHVIIRNMTSNISIELSHDIGSEIDELWRMTCNKYAYTNVRDRASIKWYAQNKELFYIKDNHQLVGYFMLFISGNTIYVTDVWGIEIEKYVKYIYSFIISKLGHKHDIRMPLYETNFNSLKGIWLPLSRPIKEKSRFLQCEDREFSKKLEKTYFTLQQGDFGV